MHWYIIDLGSDVVSSLSYPMIQVGVVSFVYVSFCTRDFPHLVAHGTVVGSKERSIYAAVVW